MNLRNFAGALWGETLFACTLSWRNSVKNLVKRSAAAVAASLVAGAAMAAGTGPAAPDLTALTPDFTTVTTAMVAIAGVVAGVIVTWKGVKFVYSALKGG